MIDAADAETARLRRRAEPLDPWSGAMAEAFRADPRRELDATLAAIASRLEPDDVLLDVGGGAGRMGLPLALRCRELIDVDPSPGMHALFDELVKGAGIANARFVEASWPAEQDLAGDVVLCAHVTYFVRDVAPFVSALRRSTRRRVIILLRSIPPPMAQAALFEAVYGE